MEGGGRGIENLTRPFSTVGTLQMTTQATAAAIEKPAPYIPTPLRVSTMTITGHLGAHPDLERLYTEGSHIPYWWIGEGILKIELNGRKSGICMENILHNTAQAKKRFFNQSSLVFRLALPDGSFKETNIKIFNKGGFQMTGISSEAMGRAAIQRFLDLNSHIFRPETGTPHIQLFRVEMMNSDFRVSGKSIRREKLYEILVKKYGLWSSYEPLKFQGVNTKFFWNKMRPATAPPGICGCPTPCEGDGSGFEIGQCRRITISPFRTGSVIIIGANCLEQLNDAYDFINGVMMDHAALVLRDSGAPAPRKITPATPTTPEAILQRKMRTSPRNILRILLPTTTTTAPTAVSPPENIPACSSENE